MILVPRFQSLRFQSQVPVPSVPVPGSSPLYVCFQVPVPGSSPFPPVGLTRPSTSARAPTTLLRHQLPSELQEHGRWQRLRENIRLLFVGWDPLQLNLSLVN